MVQVQPSQPRLSSSLGQSIGLINRRCLVRIQGEPPFALEAHQDEHPAFNRRAVGSIPIGRTKKVSRGCRQDGSSRQTFNLEIAGSNPANLTLPVSFTGLGSFATNEEKVVQFHSRVPRSHRGVRPSPTPCHGIERDAREEGRWIWSGDRARLKTLKDRST